MTVLVAAQQFPTEGSLPSREARLACRNGMASSTAGVANGFVQGNLAILPEKLAASFHRFCQLNPKPCPIIGMSDVGDPRIPALGLDLDIRTDVPRYRVWRDGEVVEEPTDIMAHWRDDLVAFVLGCSFSFEEALMEDGLPIRHIEREVRVPMYRTNIACSPSGPFAGSDGGVDAAVQAGRCDPRGADHLALSLRARRPGSSRPSAFDRHRGYRKARLRRSRCRSQADEIPVFWACGVTPQAVIASGEAAVRDHARAWTDAGDRSQEQAIGRALMGSACRFLRLYRKRLPFHR